jgi:hypothetical protein
MTGAMRGTAMPLAAILSAMVSAAASGQSFSAMSPGTGITVLVNSASNGQTGYSFRPNEDILVTKIGVIDEGGNGLVASHMVALFHRASGTMLASATIPSGAGGQLVSGSRYLDITPVVLHEDVEYYMLANNFHLDLFRFTVLSQNAFISVDSHITWVSSVISAQTNSVFTAYQPNPTLREGYGPNIRFSLNPLDCNRNNIPDDMEEFADCNANGVPDECDAAQGDDCNGNGVPDSCDIDLLPAADGDHNGILDVCELCAGDANGNGSVDVSDLLALLAGWGECSLRCFPGVVDEQECPADTNVDCLIDVTDLLNLLANWGPCEG